MSNGADGRSVYDFNLRRRSYQLWFLLLTGAAICVAALIADAASASFNGAGAIVPVVFSGMCACAGVYTLRKNGGEGLFSFRASGPETPGGASRARSPGGSGTVKPPPQGPSVRRI